MSEGTDLSDNLEDIEDCPQCGGDLIYGDCEDCGYNVHDGEPDFEEGDFL